MLSLALPVEIYLCTQPTDLRRGFDRLAQAALEHAGREVTSGGLYMFINRRRDRLKLLYWDGDGFANGTNDWKLAVFNCQQSQPSRPA